MSLTYTPRAHVIPVLPLLEPLGTGGILLIDERRPDLSYRMIERLATRRKGVLCITREPPERVERRHPMPLARYYWLVTADGGRAVHPFQLGKMRGLIQRFVKENPEGAVFIDGVEFLMVMNTYERVRDFLQALEHILRERKTECVIPIDTRTLTVNELAELRGAFPMVQGDLSG